MAGWSLSAARAIVLLFAGTAFDLHVSTGLAQAEPEAPIIRDGAALPESKKPDIENGARLAQTLCTSCHLIGETSDRPIHADVPSFTGIANRPKQTLDHLLNWLTEPHPPMPNLNLTRVEIRDLAGYMFSLRKE